VSVLRSVAPGQVRAQRLKIGLKMVSHRGKLPESQPKNLPKNMTRASVNVALAPDAEKRLWIWKRFPVFLDI